jgi:hypothetical protein
MMIEVDTRGLTSVFVPQFSIENSKFRPLPLYSGFQKMRLQAHYDDEGACVWGEVKRKSYWAKENANKRKFDATKLKKQIDKDKAALKKQVAKDKALAKKLKDQDKLATKQAIKSWAMKAKLKKAKAKSRNSRK